LTIDWARHKVIVRGNSVDLTPTEFRLLSYLARACGRVIPHQTLLREVWGAEYANQTDYLHLYIRYLRQKVENDPSTPEIIRTERGVGYYLEGD
jgi:two-component system KDP operon response regulator KdpE